jgi:K+-transporting ATPase ATPase C chain
MRLPNWVRQHIAAFRAMVVLTVITGIMYPLAVWGVSFVPGLHSNADGSLVKVDGKVVGSALLGQAFTDSGDNPLKQYFQSRPSAAGTEAWGYDPTASGASNLGPEDIVDALPNPKLMKAGKTDANAKESLLTLVCSRGLAVGRLNGVSGARPFCTSGGVGAVLSVIGPRNKQGKVLHPTEVVSVNEECGIVAKPFIATYEGVRVQCAQYGVSYANGVIVPVRGNAPANPAVPADAVTASGSGLDPDISPAYADIQVARVARVRGVPAAAVTALVHKYSDGRVLGFMGEPTVNVLRLNIALDRLYPVKG